MLIIEVLESITIYILSIKRLEGKDKGKGKKRGGSELTVGDSDDVGDRRRRRAAGMERGDHRE